MNSSHLRLRDAGEVIAALPALLGSPVRDLVVLVTSRPKPGARPGYMSVDSLLRCDLDQCLNPRSADIAIPVQICVEHDIRQVDVFFIDSHAHRTDADGKTARGAAYWRFLLRLHVALLKAGIEFGGAWGATSTYPGARWWSFVDTDHGVVPDPVAPLAAVADPHRVHSRNDVIEALEHDPFLADAVRLHLAEAARLHARSLAGDDRAALRAAIELVLSHVGRTQALAPAGLAELTVALGDHRVRDCVLGLAVTDAAEAAQCLWAALTRVLPPPERADAAVLLALSAYIRHDAGLAHAALGVALESNPAHRMALTLNVAVRIGLPPDKLRRIAYSGLAPASELGIPFP